MRWDLFCHVVDNFGDAGVCWRLASDLVSRGETVRLVIDDPAPLRWMAPVGAAGVEVVHWTPAWPAPAPADVVIEAFGCQLPGSYLQAMACVRRSSAVPPRWINLEYLSAQDYVERSHGLPSPQQQGTAQGLVKHFFYPGFTTKTGGLLREPGLLQRRAAFDSNAWLLARGWPRQALERVVTLFSYRNGGLPALLNNLAQRPTLLLLPPGPAQEQARGLLGCALHQGALRAMALPWLSQTEFDHLLWASDLNFVRGEDSLVRAMWAGAPFVWQVYPQHDGAHHAKLQAFLDLWLPDPAIAVSASIRSLFMAWNADAASDPDSSIEWPPAESWAAAVRIWRAQLAAQSDLTSQLLEFVAR